MATHASPEVRRAQILEAALGCFARKGYHAAKMDDIVRASGLSKGAIYWHFESKDEIFLALFDAYEQAVFEAWDEIEEEEVLPALRRAGDIALTQLLGAPGLLDAWNEFLAHPEARRRLARVYARSRARLLEIVRRGIERGELRECEPEHVAAALTAIVEGLLLQALVDRTYDVSAAWPTAWELVERGLARE